MKVVQIMRRMRRGGWLLLERSTGRVWRSWKRGSGSMVLIRRLHFQSNGLMSWRSRENTGSGRRDGDMNKMCIL